MSGGHADLLDIDWESIDGTRASPTAQETAAAHTKRSPSKHTKRKPSHQLPMGVIEGLNTELTMSKPSNDSRFNSRVTAKLSAVQSWNDSDHRTEGTPSTVKHSTTTEGEAHSFAAVRDAIAVKEERSTPTAEAIAQPIVTYKLQSAHLLKPEQIALISQEVSNCHIN